MYVCNYVCTYVYIHIVYIHEYLCARPPVVAERCWMAGVVSQTECSPRVSQVRGRGQSGTAQSSDNAPAASAAVPAVRHGGEPRGGGGGGEDAWPTPSPDSAQARPRSGLCRASREKFEAGFVACRSGRGLSPYSVLFPRVTQGVRVGEWGEGSFPSLGDLDLGLRRCRPARLRAVARLGSRGKGCFFLLLFAFVLFFSVSDLLSPLSHSLSVFGFPRLAEGTLGNKTPGVFFFPSYSYSYFLLFLFSLPSSVFLYPFPSWGVLRGVETLL